MRNTYFDFNQIQPRTVLIRLTVNLHPKISNSRQFPSNMFEGELLIESARVSNQMHSLLTKIERMLGGTWMVLDCTVFMRNFHSLVYLSVFRLQSLNIPPYLHRLPASVQSTYKIMSDYLHIRFSIESIVPLPCSSHSRRLLLSTKANW